MSDPELARALGGDADSDWGCAYRGGRLGDRIADGQLRWNSGWRCRASARGRIERRTDPLIRWPLYRSSTAFPLGIIGTGATPGGWGLGVKTHLAPSPYQALGLGGRSRPGRRA